MTLSHQRLSMQLVLAAVRYLKSSMCFRALINQGIAETNLKIKNIQRVKGRVISYCSPAIFAGYSCYTDLLPNNTLGAVTACAWTELLLLCLGAMLAEPCSAQPRAMHFGWGSCRSRNPNYVAFRYRWRNV